MSKALSENTSHAVDCLHVFLRDCHVNLRVGVHASEMAHAQPIIINIELETALTHYYDDRDEKKLDRVLDYEQLYKFITQELPKLGHTYLLEALGDHIVAFCFQDKRVRRVRVRIEKTRIFAEVAGAGVELIRTRGHS